MSPLHATRLEPDPATAALAEVLLGALSLARATLAPLAPLAGEPAAATAESPPAVAGAALAPVEPVQSLALGLAALAWRVVGLVEAAAAAGAPPTAEPGRAPLARGLLR